jgi:hypothetical protein
LTDFAYRSSLQLLAAQPDGGNQMHTRSMNSRRISSLLALAGGSAIPRNT